MAWARTIIPGHAVGVRSPVGSGRGKKAFWCMVGIHQLMIGLVIFISSLLIWKKVNDWGIDMGCMSNDVDVM